MDGRRLARLSVAAETRFVAPARDFVVGILGGYGLDREALRRLELAVEESCLYIVEHGFDPGETGEFDIEIAPEGDALKVAFAWQGLPIDPDKLGQDGATDEEGGAATGIALMRAFAEEVRFLNRGKAGMAIEFTRRLPARGIDEYPGVERPAPGAQPPPAADQAKLRPMRVDDAFALSRCIYRSYGYSYADFVYYPDRVRQALETRMMWSIVAENEAGEIVGHIAMLRDRADATVAESAVAVVDPRYRGQNLFKAMKTALAEEAARQGLYGLFSDAVTRHPYSQRGNVKMGAVETGLLLGYVPGTLEARFIAGAERSEHRAAVMLFFYPAAPAPRRIIHPPERHRAMLERIYGRLPLDRALAPSPAGGAAADAVAGASAVEIKLRTDIRLGHIALREIGADAVDAVRGHRDRLLRQGAEVIHLDLPLGSAATATACPALEALGFAFAGVVPEFDNGDVLRLQLLHEVTVLPEAITTGSPEGEAIRDYVLAAHSAAPAPV